jgi:hypothetical protein
MGQDRIAEQENEQREADRIAVASPGQATFN